MCTLTRHHITRVQRVLVLDESETIHQLDFRDFAGAMSVEVGFDISLGSYTGVVSVMGSRKISTIRGVSRRGTSSKTNSTTGGKSSRITILQTIGSMHTIAGEIAQVEPGRRNVRHGALTFQFANRWIWCRIQFPMSLGQCFPCLGANKLQKNKGAVME